MFEPAALYILRRDGSVTGMGGGAAHRPDTTGPGSGLGAALLMLMPTTVTR